MLGTFVEIAVPRGHETAIEAAFAAVTHVFARMSFHDERSDLASLRRAPVGQSVSVDAETVTVLQWAADLHGRSGGLFDITVGKRLVETGFLPVPAAGDLASFDGTATDIEIVDATHICCHRHVLIDLGGIAKGFAVDRAIETLASQGVANAIVNAGGDLRVLGDQPECVYLRGADGSLHLAIEIADAALASSSNTLHRRVVDGRHETPHIGRSGASVLAPDTISIIASQCVVADAMTKIALVDQDLARNMLMELNGEIIVKPTSRAA